MKRYSLLAFLGFSLMFMSSCQRKDLKILTSIDKKDSLLVLTIENTTDSNFILEFPSLDNFLYENEVENHSSESPYISKLHLINVEDQGDIDMYKKSNCMTIERIMTNTQKSIPKFLLKKSKKKYFFKLKGYKSGNTIILKDDGYDVFANTLDENKKDIFNKMRNQNCNGYKYFTGEFEFTPSKIILP